MVDYLEDLLIGVGRWEEAFQRFGPRMRSNTYLASFRKTSKKYPQLEPEKVLQACLSVSGGQDGKWFATARHLGLNELALELAQRGPCDPKTILNGARELEEKEPNIDFQMALAAVQGYLLEWAYEWSVYDILVAQCSYCRSRHQGLII